MINKRFKSFIKQLFVFVGIAFFMFVISYFAILHFAPFPVKAVSQIPYSTIIYDKNGDILRAYTNNDGRWYLPLGDYEISDDFVKATIAIEDRRFWDHPGVDVKAIARAAFQNIKNLRVISGASTISMQVVRLLDPKPRTLSNKMVEAVHALKLETIYSKKDILKLYFELAPYGGNIHGVRAAAWRYFKKSPKDLSLAESALLAGIPQSPARLRPNRYPERAKKRRCRVLSCMLDEGFIDAEQYALTNNEPINAKVYSFPFEAPHFARFVRSTIKANEIKTTIDPQIQKFAESVIQKAVDKYRRFGVTNGAIVVIENKTGNVRAYVGSADFFSIEDKGQVDGAKALRSPGSALKPFTYALGFENGFYSTEVTINDAPSRYNDYLPSNYDKKFHGPVSVREALVNSLNIPAVEVLDRVGYSKLYDLLRSSGITTLTGGPGRYGLSLTLGSCGVRLLELTNAYASLARLGAYKPYKIVEDGQSFLARRVVDQAAAYLVADILSDDERLAAIGIYHNNKMHPKIAFKTGTSFGNRDAWTFAYNPEYTIGVWLGDFMARPSKALVGIEAATPLAVEMFDWLYTEKSFPWYAMPETVGVRNDIDLFVKNASSIDFVDDIIKDSDRPKIISPASGTEYFISGPEGFLPEIPFVVQPMPTVGEVFWFLNGQFLSRLDSREKMFWNMKPGEYELVCADKYGRSSSVNFRVR